MEVPKMTESSPEEKLSWVRSQIIGGGAEFESPFGKRRITYADSTATSRSLRFIEDYILTNVLPFYGNTHTGDSYVGQQSTKMVEASSQYIKRCLRAKEEDAILFCGSGTTSAIKRLQEVMGLAIAPILRAKVLQSLQDEEKWVVFVGPYEHHSNLLSWRQSLADVVEIGLTHDGGSIDMDSLRTQLEFYERTNRPMLGSFSACSNVTGIVTDTRALARLLHRHGAFACFDFAASGPYVEINMKSGEIDGYDAVFMSPHKFIGGPGTPGILCMNKKLYQLHNYPPSTCGGGTVSYVNGFTDEDTLYLDNVEERENAGTPQIIQTVRAALTFWIKEYIGYQTIKNKESYYMTIALESLGKNNNIEILGPINKVKRLSILSFLVYPTRNQSISLDQLQNRENTIDRLLKHDQKPLNGRFVAKLLNDLFGIQARGGCACAGPYGHHLLNVDKAYSLALRASIQQSYEGVKPAWTRISFPYYMSKEEFEFVLVALEFVAFYGLRFLPLYDLNWKNGNWTINEKTFKKTIVEKRNYNKVDKFNDATTCVKDKCLPLTNKYATYIDNAMCIASLLPKYPQQGRAPNDLRDIDLPFII
ncbi:hypothetical protein RND81_13G201800 [Saponaria officinalis]|uniref:Aminotransferase class V domain-containing protein n=1 Tax=Saponaria officinalis TaxID=3572 RepID=A0AAW1H539_SAPOF